MKWPWAKPEHKSATSMIALAELLREPSPDEAGRALLERLYTDLQITGNAWAEAITLDGDSQPRGLFGLGWTAMAALSQTQTGREDVWTDGPNWQFGH
ncbi:MAG: hypothetical protein V3V03_04960, partial [Hyphomonadaceae bacterium]